MTFNEHGMTSNISVATKIKKKNTPHKAIHLQYGPHDAYNGTRRSHIMGKYPLRISPSAGTVDRKKNAYLNTFIVYKEEKKTVKTAVTKYVIWTVETTASFRAYPLYLTKRYVYIYTTLVLVSALSSGL